MKNYKVTFYDTEIEDMSVGFTNLVCFFQGKIIFVRGKGKNTWELPGGHREAGESVLECAKRELFEETGIESTELHFLCSRKIEAFDDGKSYYGKVYFVRVSKLGILPESEIEEVALFENLPEKLTYPFIQKDIFQRAKECFDSELI